MNAVLEFYVQGGAALAPPLEPWRFEREIDLLWERLGLRPGARVLELGSGSGAYLRALRDRGAKVAGIEWVDALVARSRDEDGIGVRAGDARVAALHGGELPFDACFCLPGGVLGGGTREDDLAVLRSALGMLVPGGRLFLATPHIATRVNDPTFSPLTCRQRVAVQQGSSEFAFWQRCYHRAELAYLVELAGGVVEPPVQSGFGQAQTQLSHDTVVVIATAGNDVGAQPMQRLEQWTAEFYREMGEEYLQYGFTRGTADEVDYLESVLGLRRDGIYLDVGCGIGRHALALAGRGYRVHGIDASPSLIALARAKAEAADLPATFEVQDARAIPQLAQYDGAWCLCEGGFGLFHDDCENMRVLRATNGALKPGAPFFLTALSLVHIIAERSAVDLDLAVEYWFEKLPGSDGPPMRCFNRAYLYPELGGLLGDAGFVTHEARDNFLFGRPIVSREMIEFELLARRT